jgi:hypothetical protein
LPLVAGALGDELSETVGEGLLSVARLHVDGAAVRPGQLNNGLRPPARSEPRRHHSLGSPPVCLLLFPGHLPGRPITPVRLGERLGRLGIHAERERRAALLHLAADVPAAVLADLLGIAVTTAADWAHAAGGDWSRYARPRRGELLTMSVRSIRRTPTTPFTSLNADMSLQTLMALLGHVTAEMTLRYATLASPTVRLAYDEAMGKPRRQLPIVVADRPAVPSRLAARRDAQDPGGARLLQPPSRRRGLLLRQHLRAVRELPPPRRNSRPSCRPNSTTLPFSVTTARNAAGPARSTDTSR